MDADALSIDPWDTGNDENGPIGHRDSVTLSSDGGSSVAMPPSPSPAWRKKDRSSTWRLRDEERQSSMQAAMKPQYLDFAKTHWNKNDVFMEDEEDGKKSEEEGKKSEDEEKSNEKYGKEEV
jgi:hypothetical protein